MTAFTTCPFFTVPSGVASFTDAVTMSPRRAYRPVDPPIGLMIAILRAPELSATSRIDRIWIMTVLPGAGRAEAAGQAGPDGPSVPSGLRHPQAAASPAHRCPHLERLSHDAFQRPPFAPAERTRFDDLDDVPGLRRVL